MSTTGKPTWMAMPIQESNLWAILLSPFSTGLVVFLTYYFQYQIIPYITDPATGFLFLFALDLAINLVIPAEDVDFTAIMAAPVWTAIRVKADSNRLVTIGSSVLVQWINRNGLAILMVWLAAEAIRSQYGYDVIELPVLNPNLITTKNAEIVLGIVVASNTILICLLKLGFEKRDGDWIPHLYRPDPENPKERQPRTIQVRFVCALLRGLGYLFMRTVLGYSAPLDVYYWFGTFLIGRQINSYAALFGVTIAVTFVTAFLFIFAGAWYRYVYDKKVTGGAKAGKWMCCGKRSGRGKRLTTTTDDIDDDESNSLRAEVQDVTSGEGSD